MYPVRRQSRGRAAALERAAGNADEVALRVMARWAVYMAGRKRPQHLGEGIGHIERDRIRRMGFMEREARPGAVAGILYVAQNLHAIAVARTASLSNSLIFA